jgi:hypothetical protein
VPYLDVQTIVRRLRASGTLGGIVLVAIMSIGATTTVDAVAASAPVVKCRAVAGSASVAPGLRTAAEPQTLSLDALHVSKCRTGDFASAADISGTLHSASASCPLAPDEQFGGALEIHWGNDAIAYIKAARLDPTGNPSDPFEVRLHGRITGGSNTGATLRVVLHLAPSQGDCTSGVTDLAVTNVSALSVGGPYAQCAGASGTATIDPGLTATVQAQTLHFSTFHVSGCGAAGTARSADIMGALQTDGASCPVAPGQRFRGILEIDWSNHFVSIVRHARLDSTNNPHDPYEMRLHGRVKRGADAGATLQVILHVSPTQGDCTTGVTAIAFTNVSAFTIL